MIVNNVTVLRRFMRYIVFVAVVMVITGAWAEAGAAQKVSSDSVDMLTRTGKALAEVSAAVKPSIVNISTTRVVKIQGGMDPFFEDPFFRRFFGDQYGRQRQPREHRSAGLASGVIITKDGYIITNYHVVKDADEIKVTLSDKREFKGKVVGSDPKTELSVVKIEASDLPTLAWGDSDSLQVGEIVLAVGNPFGLNQTITMGIVSAVGRANVGIADYEDFIQTDAAINPGNSGGALVNAKGELVGINTAIFSTSGGYMGIGFSIPSKMVKTIMESLVKKGKVVRGWLGVSIQKVTPELAKQFDIKGEGGVLVSDVMDNGPAEKAGLKRGDVIVEYDGKKTDDPSTFRNMVAASAPDEVHSMTLLRDQKTQTVKVTIGELPSELQADGDEYANALKGIGVQEMTPDLAKKLRIPVKVKGVVVNDVDEGSPASGVLMQGDVIQEVNKKRISSVKEYREIASRIGKDESVLVLVYRNGSYFYATLAVK